MPYDKSCVGAEASKCPGVVLRLTKTVLQAHWWAKKLNAAVVLAVALALASVVPLKVQARYAAIVVESQSGEVLFSRNANSALYPASLTKMMTLYLAFEALSTRTLSLEQRLSVSNRAAGQTPSKLGLRAGQQIAVEDAIIAVVAKSANDAATVLAEALARTEVDFAKLMTKKARKLGMKRTTFRNATGLPNRRQRSTAKDMARLAQALLRDYPEYYHFFSIRGFNYNGRKYDNHNHLLDTYAGTDGIKTGYIRASGFNVVASVERNGQRLIGVVFGGRTAQSRDKHIRQLFNRAFESLEKDTVRKPALKPTLTNISIPQIAAAAPPEAAAPEQGSTDNARINYVTPRLRPSTVIKQTVPRVTGVPNWSIQIGAFKKETDAYSQVVKASTLFPSILAVSTISVSSIIKGGQELFRARMTGLSKTDARRACSLLGNQGMPCNPVLTPKSY